MRISKKRQIEAEEVVKVICNKCGEEVVRNEEDHMSRYFFDKTIHNISISFGYGSKFDGEQWKFDICEDCLNEYVATFKFFPVGYGN